MLVSDPPMVISRPYYIESPDCGYCKLQKKDFNAIEGRKLTDEPQSIIIGMSSERVSCRQYDELMNKGFRRSGKFLYRPDLLRSCCRLYTIRTTLQQLLVGKEHRKVINRFIRAIGDGKEPRNSKGGAKFDIHALVDAEGRSKRFHTRFGPPVFTREKYELFKKYQIKVHNDEPDEVSEKSFERFLCSTPFLDEEIEGSKAEWDSVNDWAKHACEASVSSRPTGKKRRLGPTHECYYLDGKLIAISVLDFLPSGVSSVYFIWDPDYANLSLGTLSGLREILMCSELSLGFYYMGYYIDDCPKMRYKRKFGGQVLDAPNNIYYNFDTVTPMMHDGRLFVTDCKQPEASKQSGSPEEPALELLESPASEDELPEENRAVSNIAALLYTPAVFHTAEKARHSLSTDFSIQWRSSDDMPAIPSVVPGLVPLPHILRMLRLGTAIDFLPFLIFHVTTTRISHSTFSQLLSSEKAVIVDCIRVMGLALTCNSIVIA